MVDGTGDVEDDSAVVAVVAVMLETQMRVYPAGQGLHISALTALRNDFLLGDSEESYTALAVSGVKSDAVLVLSNLVAATLGQCCAGLEHSVFELVWSSAVVAGSC